VRRSCSLIEHVVKVAMFEKLTDLLVLVVVFLALIGSVLRLKALFEAASWRFCRDIWSMGIIVFMLKAG
jgi:hypothetical protein